MASFARTAQTCKRQLRDSCDALLSVLDEKRINGLAEELKFEWRDCFWRPAVVILTFLRQVLLPNCSCRAAVAYTRVDPAVLAASKRRPSGDPSAYSQARQRLPLGLLERVSTALTDQLHEPQRRWKGHRVRVADGSCVSAPDTPELQAVYPQSPSQKPGCGFPQIQMVGLFCWASGALLKLVYDARTVGELQLFRRMLELFEPGDLAVADRLYGTYCELALLSQRGAHGVFRLHNARRADFREGRRLGRYDRLMTWKRPVKKPLGMSDEVWATIPEVLTVRLLRRIVCDRRGCRTRRIDLVTTLLDPETYSVGELAELYRERWRVELSLRSLKCTQQLDCLRCESPQMVHKELAMHQIAYNLIRLLMRAAAVVHGVDAHRLSFAGTCQRLDAVLAQLRSSRGRKGLKAMVELLLQDIAADRLPLRLGRKEPRAVKRRNKEYPYLTRPRAEARSMRCYDGDA